MFFRCFYVDMKNSVCRSITLPVCYRAGVPSLLRQVPHASEDQVALGQLHRQCQAQPGVGTGHHSHWQRHQSHSLGACCEGSLVRLRTLLVGEMSPGFHCWSSWGQRLRRTKSCSVCACFQSCQDRKKQWCQLRADFKISIFQPVRAGILSSPSRTQMSRPLYILAHRLLLVQKKTPRNPPRTKPSHPFELLGRWAWLSKLQSARTRHFWWPLGSILFKGSKTKGPKISYTKRNVMQLEYSP